ncbi:hypothetical protein HG537_0D02030 [Torulaspora globosa]|uniref:4a-hydroxytetrahydrobiopterin dehydratase n=1 Tax=Torulaspora globosa TaxID=48254 RepID=A0A7H9HV16_9SACH|nr:hypothetical protein HG537_0D02030 [Torulaspora sp. CBS 2947]
MYNKLSKAVPVAVTGYDLSKALAGLHKWKLVNHVLTREIAFKDYESTWAFLTQVHMRSHLWGHHPTITTTYVNVKVELCTHDLQDQISDIDLKMARKIEEYIQVHKSQLQGFGQ